MLLPDGTVAGLEGRWEEGETEPMKYNYKTRIVLAVWLCSEASGTAIGTSITSTGLLVRLTFGLAAADKVPPNRAFSN